MKLKEHRKIKLLIISLFCTISIIVLVLSNNRFFLSKGSDALDYIHSISLIKQIFWAAIFNLSFALLLVKKEFRIFWYLLTGFGIIYFGFSSHTVVVSYRNNTIVDYWFAVKCQEFKFQENTSTEINFKYDFSKNTLRLATNYENRIMIFAGMPMAKLTLKDIQESLLFLPENIINELNNQVSLDSFPKPPTIHELFYQKQVENGHLLATSFGKWKEQYERAMIFVPAGGGNEQIQEFVLTKSDDKSIEIAIGNTEIIYHLFILENDKDALIAKYENGGELILLKYHSDSNSFKQEELAKYSLAGFTAGSKIEIKKDTILNKTAGRKYIWNGAEFE